MSKYHKIVDYINEEILNGNLKCGEKLPTIRELSEKFQCSKQTVVHAYENLQNSHVVYSIPQSGYYLVDKKKVHMELNKIINFSSGAPDESILFYENFQHCINQAIDAYKVTLFNYSSPKGLEALCRTLKEYFEDYQIFCSEEDIYITSGSQQAINILCSMPFPNGKKNVLVEQPTYRGALKSVEISETPVIGIDRNFDGLDFDDLERKFAFGNVKCFYTMPRFSNPLGLSYSNEEKKHIFKLAQKYDVYIIEDDYLGDLEIRNNEYPMYYSDVSGRTVYVKSFSKIFLPGLRVAAVVLPKVLRNTFLEYKEWMDLNTAVLSQGALEIYIKNGMFKANRKRLRKVYEDRMKTLKNEILKGNLANIRLHIPDTGFYGCLEFLKPINMMSLMNKCSKSDIRIKNMKGEYLKDYFNNEILSISIASCKSEDIKIGVKKLLSAIDKSW
ncbi:MULTISPECIES: PLP-dependent aminotransferase family protein [Clostridium]|uniref:aminotransferase-like domain-containing protein n=1 Tax=Clostridium TaxID=1485 RepID=UPI0008240FBC|nr:MULTISPECIES: PLP-dependent aminotransferase family protein [Clostridium]PJI08256.1 PLP-dependent aminotransferase family protein [Clostridium sp. CT7]